MIKILTEKITISPETYAEWVLEQIEDNGWEWYVDYDSQVRSNGYKSPLGIITKEVRNSIHKEYLTSEKNLKKGGKPYQREYPSYNILLAEIKNIIKKYSRQRNLDDLYPGIKEGKGNKILENEYYEFSIPMNNLTKELKKFGIKITDNPKKRITKDMAGNSIVADAYIIQGKGWQTKVTTDIDDLISQETYDLVLKSVKDFKTGTPAGISQMWGKV